MRKLQTAFTASVTVFLLFINCDSVFPHIGNGAISSTTDHFDNVDRFDISNACTATITHSDSIADIVISIDDNLMDDIDVRKEGSTLYIGMKHGLYQPTKFTAAIRCSSLAEASGSGASEIKISGFSSTGSFTSSLSGASSLKGALDCGAVALDLSGASDITLTGNGGELNLGCSGASDADLRSFPVSGIATNLSGASTVKVCTDGTISGSLSGASDLLYFGSPVIGSIKKSGGSDVKRGK